MIALAENQVERALHGRKPRRKIAGILDVEQGGGLFQDLLCAVETLFDRGLRAYERSGDLTRTESAHQRQHEHHLRRLRQAMVAA